MTKSRTFPKLDGREDLAESLPACSRMEPQPVRFPIMSSSWAALLFFLFVCFSFLKEFDFIPAGFRAIEFAGLIQAFLGWWFHSVFQQQELSSLNLSPT